MTARDRIRAQSKRVAEYMKQPRRYSVKWDCPHCGNSHNWWWDDEWEACSEEETTMVCDRCMTPTVCRGDGHGHYTPVEEEAAVPRTFSDRLEGLEQQARDLYDGLNALAKRVAELEQVEEKDPLGDLIDDAFEKQPNILDLIHGAKPPFHERLRERYGFNKETLDDETIAKMLRFVAVEVERMTERDMGGSFTISNLKVGERLRQLADEAAADDFVAPEEAW